MVARRPHKPKAAGSTPAPATTPGGAHAARPPRPLARTLVRPRRRPHRLELMGRNRAEGSRWHKLVRWVIRRDGGICHLCGRPGADTADHLVPLSQGGAKMDPRNLKAAHHNVWPRCNRVRGDRPIEVAQAEIAKILENEQVSAGTWEW